MFGFQFVFMTDSRCHRISRRQPGTGHFTEVRSYTEACVRIVSVPGFADGAPLRKDRPEQIFAIGKGRERTETKWTGRGTCYYLFNLESLSSNVCVISSRLLDNPRNCTHAHVLKPVNNSMLRINHNRLDRISLF